MVGAGPNMSNATDYIQGHEQADLSRASLHSERLARRETSETQGRRSYSREITEEKSYFPNLDTTASLQPPNGFDDLRSPSTDRADANRIHDDLELLRAERAISNMENDEKAGKVRSRTHNSEPEDAFNAPDQKQMLEKKKQTEAALYRIWVFLKKFPRIIRYIVYLIPGAILLLIPVLLGYFRFNGGQNAVGGRGGTYVMWFGIWLEIVWGSLWISRMVTSLMPGLFQLFAKLGGSATPKKWNDIGAQLELHTALFLWMLACLISFMPTCNGHRAPHDSDQNTQGSGRWIDVLNKVIIALFVLATLNWVEKICIQWIASSFHQRTYASRIENNKGDIGQLIALFEYAKIKLQETDSFWQGSGEDSASGAQTPMKMLHNNARQVLGKFGQMAGKVGNDLIGRKVYITHPQKVVNELLRTGATSHTLARLIYRCLVREGCENVVIEDIQQVFHSEEEAEAAFGIFDKDLNGDISLEEFEAVCNEIHLEKKAIAASLKDLDSVIQKLDKVFLFIIVVIAIIVFISILSGSAAAGLASAGTSVLGLAWMLQATAQEFLQSIIFVFVKHPFDVGDRVTVYGAGSNMAGADYYVTEVSLLYTEFRRMEGQIVQAPNSLLNTLFILNQRRSNGLADVVPLIMRFGTQSWKIEKLKERMRDFCLEHKRDYKNQIISEMVSVDEVRSCTMNIIFFHKTSYQNELLRLTRHNKFVTELMAQMVDLGIQAPVRMDPGGSYDTPMYWVNTAPPQVREEDEHMPPHSTHMPYGPPPVRRPSLASRSVAESQMANPVDEFQDVYQSRRDRREATILASISEKEAATQIEKDMETSSNAALAPVSSQGSASMRQRSRFFGRGRGFSRSQNRQDEAV